MLSSPPEVARNFPDRLQRLIGYDFVGPYLGFVEQGNPIGLLRDDDGDFARTEPELNAQREKITLLRLGEIEP